MSLSSAVGVLCSGLVSLHTMHKLFVCCIQLTAYMYAKPQQGSSNKACLGHMHPLLYACMYEFCVRIEASGTRSLQAEFVRLHGACVCIHSAPSDWIRAHQLYKVSHQAGL